MEGEMTMQPLSVDKGLAHSLKDDVYGMVLGVMFIAVGLNLLKCAGMITGGIAGIALLLAHVSSLPIGVNASQLSLTGIVFIGFFHTVLLWSWLHAARVTSLSSCRQHKLPRLLLQLRHPPRDIPR